MGDLISREALEDTFDNIGVGCLGPDTMVAVKDITRIVRKMPTVEPKRGRWISENPRTNSWTFVCSECGGKAYYPRMGKREKSKIKCGYKLCPYCGADMREEAKDE